MICAQTVDFIWNPNNQRVHGLGYLLQKDH